MRGGTIRLSGEASIREVGDCGAPHRPVVIVVDDDIPCGEVIGELLVQEVGCRVLVCTGAEQAFPLIGELRPELVILDLLMPGVGGLESLRQLKGFQATSSMPVIVCTAAAMVGTCADDLIAAGASAILRKPFDVDDLLELVSANLSGSSNLVTNRFNKPLNG